MKNPQNPPPVFSRTFVIIAALSLVAAIVVASAALYFRDKPLSKYRNKSEIEQRQTG